MERSASSTRATAFHAGGRETLRHTVGENVGGTTGEGRMWSARRTLRRRLETRCHPISLIGRCRILLARQRWTRRLRRRFTRPYALFLGPPASFRITSCPAGRCR